MKTPAFASMAAGLLLALTAPSASAAGVDTSKLPLPVPRKVDFAKEIYPIFADKCISCHGPQKQKGKYRMDTKEFALKPGKEGPFIIVGSSEKSPLIHMVAGLIEEGLMPPPSDKPGESEPLSKEQIALLRAWIDQGAVWPDGEMKLVAKELTFAADIKPVFEKSCVSCHGSAKAEGGFKADTREGVLKGGAGYGAAVKLDNAARSPLVMIVSGQDGDIPQPEKHKLPPKDAELVKKWIEQGAK